jgi:hypothetical protein
MPSPFPGMDPYLEGSLWLSFHGPLCVTIAQDLNEQLRPKYVAVTPERLVIDDIEDISISATVYPDVSLLEARPSSDIAISSSKLSAPLQMTTVMPSRRKQMSIEVRDVENRRLVTAIELLSPSNKDGRGRKECIRRRNRYLKSRVHLMEIDLLRAGTRVPMRSALPSVDYFVFLSRVGKRPLTEVWPVGLPERLPTLPVPLLKPDNDSPLDLQSALMKTYDRGSFDLLIDYRRSPNVPLRSEQSPWAAEVLRQHVV